MFGQREQIRERLTGMLAVGQRIDDGNGGVAGQFGHDGLGERADCRQVDPALKVLGHVMNGLAFAKTDLGLGQGDRMAAELMDADLEGDAGSERRFFKDHGQDAAVEKARSFAFGQTRL